MQHKTNSLSKYDHIKDLPPNQFRRLTGVKPTVFAHMLTVLKHEDKHIRRRGGYVPKLSLEDRLLLALEYLREYRTYFHIGQSYGVSESTAQRISRWVEDTLVKDKQFSLPGKKELQKSDVEYEVVLVDVAESPIERPKKDSAGTIQAKRNGTPSKAKSS